MIRRFAAGLGCLAFVMRVATPLFLRTRHFTARPGDKIMQSLDCNVGSGFPFELNGSALVISPP